MTLNFNILMSNENQMKKSNDHLNNKKNLLLDLEIIIVIKLYKFINNRHSFKPYNQQCYSFSSFNRVDSFFFYLTRLKY